MTEEFKNELFVVNKQVGESLIRGAHFFPEAVAMRRDSADEYIQANEDLENFAVITVLATKALWDVLANPEEVDFEQVNKLAVLIEGTSWSTDLWSKTGGTLAKVGLSKEDVLSEHPEADLDSDGWDIAEWLPLIDTPQELAEKQSISGQNEYFPGEEMNPETMYRVSEKVLTAFEAETKDDSIIQTLETALEIAIEWTQSYGDPQALVNVVDSIVQSTALARFKNIALDEFGKDLHHWSDHTASASYPVYSSDGLSATVNVDYDGETYQIKINFTEAE